MLAGQPSGRKGPWHAALAKAFELGRTLHARVAAEQEAGRLACPAFLKGELAGSELEMHADLERDYPLELRSPFEGVESVAGAVWRGNALFGADRDDAIMKLRFDAGTHELPLHTHDSSDRIIIVLRGCGRFHFSTQSIDSFDATDVKTVPVSPKAVLVFTNGLLHTFSAPLEPLILLSYHAPFIPLDDPRQYSLPALHWVPPVESASGTKGRATLQHA